MKYYKGQPCPEGFYLAEKGPFGKIYLPIDKEGVRKQYEQALKDVKEGKYYSIFELIEAEKNGKTLPLFLKKP